MMKRSTFFLPAALFLILCFAGTSFAQERPYEEGPVWYLTFVKTKPGMEDDYFKFLAGNWQAMLDAAQKEGLIVSSKIIGAPAANRDDWNLMLMMEVKNMAALDGLEEKMMALAAKVLGPEDVMKKKMIKLVEVREILGEKLGREIILK
jgi:hypothetical protein